MIRLEPISLTGPKQAWAIVWHDHFQGLLEAWSDCYRVSLKTDDGMHPILEAVIDHYPNDDIYLVFESPPESYSELIRLGFGPDGDYPDLAKALLEGSIDWSEYRTKAWLRIHPRNLALRAQQSPSGTHHYIIATWNDSFLFPSGRPYTPMTLFRQPNFRTIRRSQLPDSISSCEVQVTMSNGEIHYLVPVSRYAAGPEVGLYHPVPSTKHLGTFYYLEPGSDSYLDLGESYQFQTYPGKYQAASELYILIRTSHLELANLLLERMEEIRTIAGSSTQDPYAYALDLDRSAPGWGFAPALEDRLDQPLARAMAALALDVLILTQMQGRDRIVSEILDVRPRLESFRNLVWVID